MLDVQAPIESIMPCYRVSSTKHCSENIKLAKFIERKKFKDRGLQNNGQAYKIMVRNDEQFPACGCET